MVMGAIFCYAIVVGNQLNVSLVSDDVIQSRILSKVIGDITNYKAIKFQNFQWDLFVENEGVLIFDFREHSDLRSKVLGNEYSGGHLESIWIWGPDDSFYRRNFMKLGLLTFFPDDSSLIDFRYAILGLLYRDRQIDGGLFASLPGPFRLDSSMQQLYFNENSCALSSTEFRIFVALFEAQDQFLPRNEIRDRVWGQNFNISVRSIDSHISRMRRKLPDHFLKIESDRNNGYHLIVNNKV